MYTSHKKIVLILLLLTQSLSYSQMFDYLEYKDKSGIEKLKFTTYVRSSFDDFQKKFEELVKWELKQFERVQQEIDKRTEDLPNSKALLVKYRKYAELESLITDKEIDLDFEYYYMYDEINEKVIEEGVEYVFEPHSKAEGRVHRMILEDLIKDKKELELVKKYIDHTVDGITLVSGAFTGGAAVFFVETLAPVSVDVVTNKAIEKILNNYVKYYAKGKYSDDEFDIIEKFENEKNNTDNFNSKY